jgi:hypothetical protein
MMENQSMIVILFVSGEFSFSIHEKKTSANESYHIDRPTHMDDNSMFGMMKITSTTKRSDDCCSVILTIHISSEEESWLWYNGRRSLS